MNQHLCPACHKSLRWNGMQQRLVEADLVNKRWYQYVPMRIFCRHCGSELVLSTRNAWLALRVCGLLCIFSMQAQLRYTLAGFVPVAAITGGLLLLAGCYLHACSQYRLAPATTTSLARRRNRSLRRNKRMKSKA